VQRHLAAFKAEHGAARRAWRTLDAAAEVLPRPEEERGRACLFAVGARPLLAIWLTLHFKYLISGFFAISTRLLDRVISCRAPRGCLPGCGCGGFAQGPPDPQGRGLHRKACGWRCGSGDTVTVFPGIPGVSFFIGHDFLSKYYYSGRFVVASSRRARIPPRCARGAAATMRGLCCFFSEAKVARTICR